MAMDFCAKIDFSAVLYLQGRNKRKLRGSLFSTGHGHFEGSSKSSGLTKMHQCITAPRGP